MKKLSMILLGSLFLYFISILILDATSFTEFWKRFLVVSIPMQKSDAIIVLGGEPIARPQRAANLFKAGVAPLVFITGVGDAMQNKHVLIDAGVPDSAIVVESQATTTYNNALLLKPLLDRAHIRSALIVTSPFHTRRALTTFCKVIPEVNFGITDASIPWWGTLVGKRDLNKYAVIECVKTVEYWLLHGISPLRNRL